MILFQLSFGRKKRKLLHVLWVWERQCGKLDLFWYRNLLLSWITSSLPRTWEGDTCPQAEEGSWCPGFSAPASLVPLEDSWAFPCTPTPFQKVPSNSTLKPLEETSPPRHPVWSILGVYRAIDVVGENVRNLHAGKGREVSAGGWRPAGVSGHAGVPKKLQMHWLLATNIWIMEELYEFSFCR